MMELRALGISRRYLRKTKERNVFEAVKTTDFFLQPAALTEILGRSGSGKSTLLHILAGVLAPSTGQVLLDGTDLYALQDEERSAMRSAAIGVIPQGRTALQSLTVLENVLLPCAMYGIDGREQAAEELLERLGILSLRDVYPNELSGGELRRLAIARALIRHPAIVLADEPTGDLDDENTEAVLQILREIAHSGAAVLLITHEQGAERYADSIYRMHDGILTSEGSTDRMAAQTEGKPDL